MGLNGPLLLAATFSITAAAQCFVPPSLYLIPTNLYVLYILDRINVTIYILATKTCVLYYWLSDLGFRSLLWYMVCSIRLWLALELGFKFFWAIELDSCFGNSPYSKTHDRILELFRFFVLDPNKNILDEI